MYEGLARSAPVSYLEAADSTNTRLKAMARKGAEHGSVLIAGSQSEGRGRLGRSFISPEGGLYLSMLLRPDMPPEKAARLGCAAALAVCAALEDCGVQGACIKWPNDLLLCGKKLCGILCEAGHSSSGSFFVVLGIGVNVSTVDFPPELRDIAGSVYSLTGLRLEPEQLGRALIEQLDRICAAWGRDGEAFIDEYRRRCISPGKPVFVSHSGKKAMALSIEDDYALRLRYEGGIEDSVSFGEIFHME